MTCGWSHVQARTEEARLTLLGCPGERPLLPICPVCCWEGDLPTRMCNDISLHALAAQCLAMGDSKCSKQLHRMHIRARHFCTKQGQEKNTSGYQKKLPSTGCRRDPGTPQSSATAVAHQAAAQFLIWLRCHKTYLPCGCNLCVGCTFKHQAISLLDF